MDAFINAQLLKLHCTMLSHLKTVYVIKCGLSLEETHSHVGLQTSSFFCRLFLFSSRFWPRSFRLASTTLRSTFDSIRLTLHVCRVEAWHIIFVLQIDIHSLVPRLPRSGTRTLKLCRRTYSRSGRAWERGYDIQGHVKVISSLLTDRRGRSL